ncbi:hypothetical protein ZHS_108 [Edwardsiella phage vB_EpM_ZHS]|nr:hypothetical protein ZHS_108 [Edwardsiella phage vB_EpM_ZHS]
MTSITIDGEALVVMLQNLIELSGGHQSPTGDEEIRAAKAYLEGIEALVSLSAHVHGRMTELVTSTARVRAPVGRGLPGEAWLLDKLKEGVADLLAENADARGWQLSKEEILSNQVDPRQLRIDAKLQEMKATERFFVFKALDNMGLTTEERLYLCGDATYDNGWRDMWQAHMREPS